MLFSIKMHFVLLINSLTSTSIQGNPLEMKQLALGVEINVLVQCRRELIITTSTFCFSLCMMKERPSHLLVIFQGYLNAAEVPCISIWVLSESPSPKEHPWKTTRSIWWDAHGNSLCSRLAGPAAGTHCRQERACQQAALRFSNIMQGGLQLSEPQISCLLGKPDYFKSPFQAGT